MQRLFVVFKLHWIAIPVQCRFKNRASRLLHNIENKHFYNWSAKKSSSKLTFLRHYTIPRFYDIMNKRMAIFLHCDMLCCKGRVKGCSINAFLLRVMSYKRF